jgi:hypothetical protein
MEKVAFAFRHIHSMYTFVTRRLQALPSFRGTIMDQSTGSGNAFNNQHLGAREQSRSNARHVCASQYIAPSGVEKEKYDVLDCELRSVWITDVSREVVEFTNSYAQTETTELPICLFQYERHPSPFRAPPLTGIYMSSFKFDRNQNLHFFCDG